MNLYHNMNLSSLAISLLLTGFAVAGGSAAASAATPEDTAREVMAKYRPGSTGFGEVKVEKVSIDHKKHTITVDCDENASYLPFTAERLEHAKDAIRRALGKQYSKYKVTVNADGRSLDELVLFAPKDLRGPSEKEPFVTDLQAAPAPLGLDGANIALWQSHGWYFEPKLNRWEWQRARLFQTVEDLYTQSYVMPFLMPMLENAGAYVMSPRERDINLTEIIVDADNAATPGYSETVGMEEWTKADVPGFGWDGEAVINGQNPFRDGSARIARTVRRDSRTEPSTAVWSADIPRDDNYAVYVSYITTPASATDAQYTIYTTNGPRNFKVNQSMGGGTWIYLGHFPLKAGKNRRVVELSNYSRTPGATVSADAVKIGGGKGVVARIVKEPDDSAQYRYVQSGYPKFTEAARYFLQWSGAPDSVFTPSDYAADYSDDYKSRGLWVNWLAGGSSQLPAREGLGIPVDLSFALHSDAGTFRTDTIVGSLGIYSSAGDTLGNGSSRLASRDLTDLVLTNIANDVRTSFEPRWTRRGMWDKSYFEARSPQVPAMLLELLSHQNFYDMQYGLDPAFRFTVSRAIYKGILEFIAHRDGRKYVVQPLPVRAFAISPVGNRQYRLTWQATPDSLESTAMPDYYIVEHRRADGLGFEYLAKTEKPEYTVDITDTDIHSYRIIAANKGGVSFPSEVLALCDLNNGTAPVLVVNGFTRVSAPDSFEASEEIAGFYDARDHGVPYLYDISYIGSQFEFRRDIPWMDDDAAGFGASRSNYEDKVIAGNTFDYVYTHGRAIAAANRSFCSASVAAYQEGLVPRAEVTDLILGKQKEVKRGGGAYGTRFKTFPSALQQRMSADAEAGTDFFVSGAFVATDLWDNPYSSAEVAEADAAFATSILGYKWRVGQASVTGEAYEVPCRFKEFDGDLRLSFYNNLNPDCYAIESPDSFFAPDSSTGCTLLRYGENNLVAGTANAFPSGRKAVVIGFPFETITSEAARDSLMSQILSFFNKK